MKMREIKTAGGHTLYFNSQRFYKIILIVLGFNLLIPWTSYLEIAYLDHDFVSFSPSFILGVAYGICLFKELNKPVVNTLLIGVLFLVTFYASSFIILSLFARLETLFTTSALYTSWFGDFCSSAFSATILVLIINHFSPLHFRLLTIIFTILFAIIALWVFDLLYSYETISPFFNIYFIWQTLTSIPIALGMSTKRAIPTVRNFSNSIYYLIIILIIAFTLVLVTILH